MRELEKTTALPGIFATISAGFDLTARHLWLLTVPVVLDVFYWLGPRMRFQDLIAQLLELLPAEAEVLELGSQLADAAPRTNLFTSLTVQLIGVPALMVGMSPESTPVATQVHDVSSWSTWLGLFLVLSVAGLLLTALYYTLISAVVSKQTPESNELGIAHWSKRILSSWLRLIGLTVIFFFIVMAFYIPLIFIGTILYLINATLGSVTLLIAPLIIAWIVIVLSLAPFGIVLNGRPVLRAVIESVRLVQKHLLSILYLLFFIFVTGAILDWLLFAVENGSWLTLANIVGHAFVSTALVATMFIFYRDRYAVMFEPEAEYEIRPLHDSDN